MANSITLSQSLIDDIAQKIQDGTATAEQVVLYTKGLQQLQEGNDFQAVIIGLSQSAVDAIDSANAQFQEDAQTALNTFSQTATNIDTSASNAVSAINIAKDTLVATDAEITTTIEALPNDAKIEEISTHISYSNISATRGVNGTGVGTNDVPHWTGVHELPRKWKNYSEGAEYDMIHPWNAPAYLQFNTLTAAHGWWSVVNSFGDKIDEIPVTLTSVDDTAASVAYLMGKNRVHHGYHALTSSHTYWFDNLNDQPSTNSGMEVLGTAMFGPYGQSRYHSSNAWKGMYPGFIFATNTTGSNDRRSSSMSFAVIVGETHKDWCMTRPWADHKVYLSSSRNIAEAQYSRSNRSDYLTRTGYAPTTSVIGYNPDDLSKLTQEWGKGYDGDWILHETFEFNSFQANGMGNIAYNANTNKFAYIDIFSASPYARHAKLMTVASDFNLRDVALGKTPLLANNYDPIANGKMTIEIDSQFDFRAAADAISNAAYVNSEDVHNGQLVLCDNDTLINVWAYENGTNRLRATRLIKNSSNTDYELDISFERTLQTWSGDYDYAGVTHRVTNDGRYVAVYTHDYYYFGGINGFFVRVSDGAVLQFEVHNSGSAFAMVPIKHNEFLFKHQLHTNYHWNIDMDWMFANNNDGDDVSSIIYHTTNHNEYGYRKGIHQRDRRDFVYNYSIWPIYQPYNYLTDYYNVDGTRKSQYDRNLNLIP